MIKAIAVDDEPVALDVIKNQAEKVEFIRLEAFFLSTTSALRYVKANPVDLIFLDISMPDLTGIEFAAMVNDPVQIIFTTAHAEHALKGFELAATDYLLKPINFSRFLKACQLAESRQQVNQNKPSMPETLFVKDAHNWIPVKLSDLCYIRGEDNYVNLFQSDKHTLTRMTLTELEQKLPAGMFLRVHKSYIISLSKIDKLEKHQVTIGDAKIPLTLISAESILRMINR